MAHSIAGNHTILNGPGNSSYLDISLDVNVTIPLILPVVVSNSSGPQWNIAPVGGNVYTIFGGGYPISVQADNCLHVVLPTASEPATVSIEPAGDNQYRFHVPDVDLVWTVVENQAFPHQVCLRPAEGTPEQLWTLD